MVIVDIYVATSETAAITAVQNALDTVYGETGNTLAGTAGSYKFCRTPMSESGEEGGQLQQFISLVAIQPVCFNVVTNTERSQCTLLSTRSDNANISALIGQNLPFATANTYPEAPAPVEQADVYVASDAIAGSGDGTEQNPVTLREALFGSPIKATTNIYLADGEYEYAEDLNLYVNGVDIHGPATLVSTGGTFFTWAETTWHRVRFTANPATRTSHLPDQDSSDLTDFGAFNTRAKTNLIRCEIDNLRLIGHWSEAAGSQWHGVLIHDIGRYSDHPDDPRAPDGHGHTCYTQNNAQNADERKLFTACVMIKGFGKNVQQYGTSSVWLRGYRYTDSIFMHPRFLMGGTDSVDKQVDDTVIDNCAFLGVRPEAGYQNKNNGSVTITNCMMAPAGAYMQNFETLTVTNNIFAVGNMTLTANVDRSGWTIDNNTYYANGFKIDPGGNFGTDFEVWKTETGFDANSTYNAGLPTSPIVRVIPVADCYDLVGLIAVYNPQLDATVDVDLTALGLTLSANYELRQVRDYHNDIRPFTYDGDPLTVSMSGTLAWPKGYNNEPAVPALDMPRIAAFMVCEV